MIAPLESTVVMPTWVFLCFFLGGIAFLVFLMWANHTQAHDLRRSRRQVMRLRVEASDPERLRGLADAVAREIPRQRDGSAS